MNDQKVLIVEDVLSTSAGMREALIQRGSLARSQVVESYSLADARQKVRQSRDHPFRVIAVDLVLDGDQWAGAKMVEFLAKQKPQVAYTVILHSRLLGNGQTFKPRAYWEELDRRIALAEETGYVVVRGRLEQLGDHATLSQLVPALLSE